MRPFANCRPHRRPLAAAVQRMSTVAGLCTSATGGRPVICGWTSGISASTNLYALFQQQPRIGGSFGSIVRRCRESLDKMADGIAPVIDSGIALADFPVVIDRQRPG